MKRNVCLILFLSFIGAGCRQQTVPELQPTAIASFVGEMTNVMVHDITNPPLASRFFAYACLAGYEVVAQNNPAYKSMHGVLKKFPKLQKPDAIKGYSYQLAATLAIMETAKKLQPSGSLLEEYQNRFLDSCRRIGYDEAVIESSKAYAQAVSRQILAYAKADGYNKISNLRRYTPSTEEGSWFPTPPAYIAAIEPHFNTVRPFTLDSCSQFKPPPPVPFSQDKKSAFYKLILQNYTETLTGEHRAIAAFWDCNPFAVQDNGHLLIGLKKISPGAHWMGITGIACQKAAKDFDESMQVFTTVSIGLMDAFICCWDEKYRSNRIRPETAIRKYIDASWVPLIQTPPFPEYLSGHSVISATSATILTHYFGKAFQYTDDVEVRYGLPARTFDSFLQAAGEAGLSRFYGGIHFMDAVDNGLKQGVQVGAWVIEKVEPAKSASTK